MASNFDKNTLLRYKLIKELYLQFKTEDIPDSVILRKYINPVYPISRSTMVRALTTDIDKELNAIIQLENQQS